MAHYLITLEVAVPQPVRCSHCDHEFVYETPVAGLAKVYPPLGGELPPEEVLAKGREIAVADQLRQLKDPKLCSPVPCPKCLRYQPYMARRAGQEAYQGVLNTGALISCVGVLALIFAVFILIKGSPRARASPEDFFLFAGGIVALGLLVVAFGYFLIGMYNPNRRHSKARRQRIADDRAMDPDEFAGRLTDRLREAYDKYAADRLRWQKVCGPSGAAARFSEAPEPEQPVIDWWVDPSLLKTGGSVSLPVADGRPVSVDVPAGTKAGKVIDINPDDPAVLQFKVRVLPIRVHPAEKRPDPERHA
jgi:hypothetical protein